METKGPNFAYTTKESVDWLIASDGPYSPLDRGAVFSRVGKMIESGWDNRKILERCKNFHYLANRKLLTPLVQVVYHDHPIIKEWGENTVRTALFETALAEIVQVKTYLFKESFKPEEKRGLLTTGTAAVRMIENLEEFADRITQEAAPAKGIRNR